MGYWWLQSGRIISRALPDAGSNGNRELRGLVTETCRCVQHNRMMRRLPKGRGLLEWWVPIY